MMMPIIAMIGPRIDHVVVLLIGLPATAPNPCSANSKPASATKTPTTITATRTALTLICETYFLATS